MVLINRVRHIPLVLTRRTNPKGKMMNAVLNTYASSLLSELPLASFLARFSSFLASASCSFLLSICKHGSTGSPISSNSHSKVQLDELQCHANNWNEENKCAAGIDVLFLFFFWWLLTLVCRLAMDCSKVFGGARWWLQRTATARFALL